MRKLAFIALLLTTSASAASMDFIMKADDNLAGVALVRYIKGDYATAVAPLVFLNPFKNVTRDYRGVVSAIITTYDKDKNGYLNEGEEYEAFLSGAEADIALVDKNKDGNIDNNERRVLAELVDDIEEARGSAAGCDAALKLGDEFGWQSDESLAVVGSIIPIWKKCKVVDGKSGV